MSRNETSNTFPDDLAGFPGIRLAGNDGGTAFIACQGAQVLSWQTQDGRERLYLSALSGGMQRDDAGTATAPAIRGGVPVCFPQFSGRGPLVKHGFARSMAWRREAAGGAIRLALGDSEETRRQWPHAFHAEASVSLAGDTLSLSLTIGNTGGSPWSFTAALHTYLAVADIRDTLVHGLKNVRYQDATAGNAEQEQHEDLLGIAGEIDRVYLSSPREVRIMEAGSPSLRIRQEGFEDTVVWNPGPQKARTLKDFPDEDWLRMLCVEAAQVEKPVLLQPGQTWRGSQVLCVAHPASAT